MPDPEEILRVADLLGLFSDPRRTAMLMLLRVREAG